MKKLTCVLAILAAASTAALAGEIKQDKKATAPALTATQMGDDEMDKVTAGSTPSSRHEGTITAEDAGGNANAFGILKHGETPSGVVPGRGNITAVSTPGHQP
jgi:hypothetical protein